MKTLYINRHAKSSWGNQDLRDYDRPLNDRGTRDAAAMSKRFAENKPQVDFILSSSAVRARATAQDFANALGISGARYEERGELYLASLKDLVQIVSKLPNEHDHVMVFGHNPGLSYLVDHFTGEMVDMPTCARARIEFHIDDWALASAQMGSLKDFDYPKKHQQ